MRTLHRNFSLVLVALVSGALRMAIPDSPGNPLRAAEKLPRHAEQPAEGLIRSAHSGAWSAAATWERGRVPGAGARVQVRGTTADNGTVKKVLVNGRAAKATTSNFSEWEIVLDGVQPGETKLTASAEDAAGNVEKLPHTWATK